MLRCPPGSGAVVPGGFLAVCRHRLELTRQRLGDGDQLHRRFGVGLIDGRVEVEIVIGDLGDLGLGGAGRQCQRQCQNKQAGSAVRAGSIKHHGVSPEGRVGIVGSGGDAGSERGVPDGRSDAVSKSRDQLRSVT